MSDELTPRSRVEQLLDALLNGAECPEPRSRVEKLLSALLKGEVPDVTPLSRAEAYLLALCQKGIGSPSGTVINNQDKTITANGEYTADVGYTGLGKVVVDVPTSGGGSDSDTALIGLIERTATEFTIPEGCTKVGAFAFYMNDTLKSVNFPDGLTSIGDSVFYKCTNLALTSLPDGLTSISRFAFDGCTNLALTSLPDSLTSIGEFAFDGCTNLALTSLPDGLTTIGGAAFFDCTSLTKLTFKGKPSSIASNAFYGCTNLLTINVPWAEGEVANAPWGATNATINYNYVEEG